MNPAQTHGFPSGRRASRDGEPARTRRRGPGAGPASPPPPFRAPIGRGRNRRANPAELNALLLHHFRLRARPRPALPASLARWSQDGGVRSGAVVSVPGALPASVCRPSLVSVRAPEVVGAGAGSGGGAGCSGPSASPPGPLAPGPPVTLRWTVRGAGLGLTGRASDQLPPRGPADPARAQQSRPPPAAVTLGASLPCAWLRSCAEEGRPGPRLRIAIRVRLSDERNGGAREAPGRGGLASALGGLPWRGRGANAAWK